jgi:magnesium-transporting ATPase (P-type)
MNRAGQAVPADLFLLSATSLEIDEAAVTGESIPNPKRVGVRAGRGRGGEEGGGGGGGGGEGEETGSSVLSVVVMGEGEGGGKGEGQEREGKEGAGEDVLISEEKAYAGPRGGWRQ